MTVKDLLQIMNKTLYLELYRSGNFIHLITKENLEQNLLYDSLLNCKVVEIFATEKEDTIKAVISYE